MKTFRIVFFAIALLLDLGLVFAVFGIYDVSAREPYWGITSWFLHMARERSVDFHKSKIELPPSRRKGSPMAFPIFMPCAADAMARPGFSPEEFARDYIPNLPRFHPFMSVTPAPNYWIIATGKLPRRKATTMNIDDGGCVIKALISKCLCIDQCHIPTVMKTTKPGFAELAKQLM